MTTLEELIEKQPLFADTYLLLGGIYEKQGKKNEAEKVYNKALATEGMPDTYKVRMKAKLDAVKGTLGEAPRK